MTYQLQLPDPPYFNPEDGSSMFIQNVDVQLEDYVATL
jgi:hypothetical protein